MPRESPVPPAEGAPPLSPASSTGAEHAAALGVPHGAILLACMGDGIEHLLLRAHLYVCHAQAAQAAAGSVGRGARRARSHCLMIGTNNLLADLGQAEQAERGGKLVRQSNAADASIEMSASAELVVQGIQEAVDVLRAAGARGRAPHAERSSLEGGGAALSARQGVGNGEGGGEGGGSDVEGGVGDATASGETPDERAEGEGQAGDGLGTSPSEAVVSTALTTARVADGEQAEEAEGGDGGADEVFVCKLLHVLGTEAWVATANARIDAVNALLGSRLTGATVIRPAVPSERRFYDASGIHLSLVGYKRLVTQLNNLIPSLNAQAKADSMAEAKAAEEEAAAAIEAAQAALAAAEEARKAVLQSKVQFSKAKAETAQAIKVGSSASTF